MSRREKGGGKAAVDSESWMVDRRGREGKTNSLTSLSLTATGNPLSYLSEHGIQNTSTEHFPSPSYLSEHRTQNTEHFPSPFPKGEGKW